MRRERRLKLQLVIVSILSVVIFVLGMYIGFKLGSKEPLVRKMPVIANGDDDKEYVEEIKAKVKKGKLSRDDLIYANADDEGEYREEEKNRVLG